MTQPVLPSSWRGIRFGEVRRALLAFASLLIAPLTAALTVWADMSISSGRWPIFPGAIAVIIGMFLAFGAASFPVLPRSSIRSRGEMLGYMMFTVGAAIPAVVAGIGIGLAQPTISVRVMVVVVAMLIGVGLRRHRSPPPLCCEVPLWLRVLDAARQGVLMLIVAIAALLYVSAPSLIVTW